MIYNNNTYSFPNTTGGIITTTGGINTNIGGSGWYPYNTSFSYLYILGDYINNVLLNDVEVNMIATLNLLGEPYWIELKRLNYKFSVEIEDFIEKRIKIERRNKNIDIITNS